MALVETQQGEILPIRLYDDPVLRTKAVPVEEIDDHLLQLIRSMFATLHNASGIGLAANQVGHTWALTVIDISDLEEGEGTEPMVLINPVIEAFSEELVEFEEGCLSLPDLRATVIRPAEIQVRFYDEQMREHRMTAGGLLARVMQHEIDHLNGIYFFDRLSPVQRARIFHKLRQIRKGQVNPPYPVVAATKQSAKAKRGKKKHPARAF